MAVGTVLAPGDLRAVEVNLGEIGGSYVSAGEVPVGQVLVIPVAAGELLPAGAVTASEPARMVVLSVEPERIPPGVAHGTRIDIYLTVDAVGSGAAQQGPATELVGADITVQSVSAPSSGGLSGASSARYQVSVLLDPEAADGLVRMLPTGDITVVLRTGAVGDRLLTLGSGRTWESDLVAALDRPGAEFTVVRRCADIAEVLASAGTGRAGVVVIDANARRLDSDVLQRLTAAGVAVVAVHQSGDERTAQRLELLGIEALVGEEAGTAVMTAAARESIAALGSRLPGPGSPSDPRQAVPRHGVPSGPAPVHPPPPALGRVVAVWGPTGAPGRTTVALGLADASAVAQVRTLLIDADVYGGVLANALGLLDESPGLAGACRLAANGRLDEAALLKLSWSIEANLLLLTGIARADRWPEVRPSTIPQVLGLARRQAGLTVVDCGFAVEAEEELSFDAVAPRRNGATLAVLAEADVVLAVGSADPPGMERLVRGLQDLAEAVPGVRPRVVLNRQRSGAASTAQAQEALLRFTGLESIAVIPEDRAATDAAWTRAGTLSAVSAGSPLRSAFDRLARQLIPAAVRPVAGRSATGAGRRR